MRALKAPFKHSLKPKYSSLNPVSQSNSTLIKLPKGMLPLNTMSLNTSIFNHEPGSKSNLSSARLQVELAAKHYGETH